MIVIHFVFYIYKKKKLYITGNSATNTKQRYVAL